MMEVREVQTPDGTRWQCVEAMINNAEQNDNKTPGHNVPDRVTVVCTPSGGEQTVRIELQKDWMNAVPDEELVKSINEAKQN